MVVEVRKEMDCLMEESYSRKIWEKGTMVDAKTSEWSVWNGNVERNSQEMGEI